MDFIELFELIKKLKVLEIVTLEMALPKLSSGLGDQSKKKLMNFKLLNILMQEGTNFNIIKDWVLTLSAQEEQTQLWFITHQQRPTILISRMIWFILLIQEDSTWMVPLTLPEHSTLENQPNRKKILIPEFFLETWTFKDWNGLEILKLLEVTSMY